ncbi:helix-turn-helix domain-containing protein [Ancylobacter sp. WKF20]|uniref:winged helix-turn-helix transcriptional regulator n=1 Tax=Ancylobacter sp. WKF20 TaxID=3039801 RepID=UPI0024345B20|nr:helix-turn-helix domain-containing protein [Ancylobacter sp. WKF20]WGD30012.1 helix-turn-helix domain-containing protein [Ancylobacter sp. WKF20]
MSLDRETFKERVRRGELRATDCPSREVLKHVSSLWGTLCLLILRDGTMRFSELRRMAAGVSEKMLAQTLRLLEEDGFVVRRSFPVVPPHVEYSLTPMGREVADHLGTLTDWIEGNVHRILGHRQSAEAAGTAGESPRP